MDPADNEQTELLRHIWNEMKALGTNLGGRLDHLTGRVDHLTGRVDHLTGRVDHLTGRVDGVCAEVKATNARLDQTNLRLGAVEETLHELAAQQVMLGRYVKHTSQRAIDELRERVGRPEDVLALGRR